MWQENFVVLLVMSGNWFRLIKFRTAKSEDWFASRPCVFRSGSAKEELGDKKTRIFT